MQTLIPRSVLTDRSLSLAARGLYGLLCSLRQEERSESRLLTMAPSGKDKLRSTLRELESAGHLVRRWARNDDGTTRARLYILPAFDQEAA